MKLASTFKLFNLLLFSFSVGGLGLMGCTKKKSEQGELTTLTPEVLVLDKVAVNKGKVIFDAMCVACHQKDGLGKAGFGPSINNPDFLGLASDQFIKRTIMEGRPGTAMMAYKNIPMVKDKIDSLVTYIRSWQNDYALFKDYAVDESLKISGDMKAGKANFRNFCAACHGPNGSGYADGGSGPGIGLPGFLKVASDDYIKKTILIGRAGTAMKPFGHSKGVANLDDKVINGIVAYLRSLEK